MNEQPYQKSLSLMLALIGASFCQGVSAGATIELGNDVGLDWTATAAYAVSARAESRDPKLSGTSPSASDGNNNFGKGDLTSNRLSLLLETRLHKGLSGIVLSGSTFYDDVYHHSTDNDDYPIGAHPGDRDKFGHATKRYHGGYTKLLDFYGYTSQRFGDDVYANFRVGKHVVAWGESLFLAGISSAQGPADATKSDVPGAELKDILLPEDQVSTNIQIGNNWEVMAHIQYGWHRTVIPQSGSFMSIGEGVAYSDQCLGKYVGGVCNGLSRAGTNTPSDFGQWGVGVRYRLTQTTELGLYYLKYNDRIPLPDIDALNGTYVVNYFDKIDLVGASFSTSWGAASIAGEMSYKDNAPVMVNTKLDGASIPSATRGKILQSNLNTIYNLGRTAIAPDTSLSAEVAYVSVLDADKRSVTNAGQLQAAGSNAPETDSLYTANHGLAISGTLALGYPGFTENWDLSVPINYSQQISGSTLSGGVGGEGDIRGSVGANFTHRTGLEVEVSYVGYFGSAEIDDPRKARNLTDRDYVSLAVKKAF